MTLLDTVILFLVFVLGFICGVIFSGWADRPLTDAEIRMDQHLMELDEFEEKLK